MLFKKCLSGKNHPEDKIILHFLEEKAVLGIALQALTYEVFIADFRKKDPTFLQHVSQRNEWK